MNISYAILPKKQGEDADSSEFRLRNASVSDWAAKDSNLRLPPCEDGTLTTELAARHDSLYIKFAVIASGLERRRASPVRKASRHAFLRRFRSRFRNRFWGLRDSRRRRFELGHCHVRSIVDVA